MQPGTRFHRQMDDKIFEEVDLSAINLIVSAWGHGSGESLKMTMSIKFDLPKMASI